MMMTAQEQTTFRTVFVDTTATEGSPAELLLNRLGHEVIPAESTDAAVRLLEDDHVNLVVLHANEAEQSDFLVRVSRLAARHQPRVIAIISDEGAAVPDLHMKGMASRVQILLKPLHVHGLLGVVKSLERRD